MMVTASHRPISWSRPWKRTSDSSDKFFHSLQKICVSLKIIEVMLHPVPTHVQDSRWVWESHEITEVTHQNVYQWTAQRKAGMLIPALWNCCSPRCTMTHGKASALFLPLPVTTFSPTNGTPVTPPGNKFHPPSVCLSFRCLPQLHGLDVLLPEPLQLCTQGLVSVFYCHAIGFCWLRLRNLKPDIKQKQLIKY